MRNIFFATLLLAIGVQSAVGQDKPAVYVLKNQDKIEIKIDVTVMPEEFIRNYAGDINNYYFFEAKNVDDLTTRVSDELSRIGKLQNLDEVKEELARLTKRLNDPPPNLVKPGSSVENPADGQRLTLTLSKKLEYNKNYILKIKGLDLSTKAPAEPTSARPQLKPPGQAKTPDEEVAVTTVNVPYPMDPTAELLPSLDIYDQRRIRVVSNGPVASPNSVVVQQRTLKIRPDLTGLVPYFESIVADRKESNDNSITFELRKKLRGGTAYNLLIPEGISDGSKPIRVNGAIKFPSASSPPDVPRIDLSFSSVAAVHQKGVLELNLKAVPVKPLPMGNGWFREPKIEVDLGLRSTKSANAVKVAYLFRKILFAWPLSGRVDGEGFIRLAGNKKVKTTIPAYANWATTPWYKPSTLRFYVGPKFETDRKFQRINSLANIRFDFNFHRWRGSIADRRQLLKRDLQDQPNIKKEVKNDFNLIDIPRGLRIVPSLSFDLGGHVNNETVTNAKKNVSVVVPRHKILRIIPGFTGTIEWRTFSLPTTLTLDESVTYLAAREQIGLTTDTGVALRVLRGFHPRFVNSVDFALDPAKHYSFVITFENGRSAPNFEYLNKVTAGIKVRFGSADQAPTTK